MRGGRIETAKATSVAPRTDGVKPPQLYAFFTVRHLMFAATDMIAPSATSPIIGRSSEIPQGTAASSGASAAATPAAATEAGLPSAWPNPSLRLDAALGIIVMEFRDKSGGVASTLPTERELQAYRSAASRPRADVTGQIGGATPRQSGASGLPDGGASGVAAPSKAAAEPGPPAAPKVPGGTTPAPTAPGAGLIAKA